MTWNIHSRGLKHSAVPQQAVKEAKLAAESGDESYVPPEQRSSATFLPGLLDDFSQMLLTIGAPAGTGEQFHTLGMKPEVL